MNEENNSINEPQKDDWQPPPIPEEIENRKNEEPEMSEVGTLANIFIEKGKTFQDLKRKPRFIIAAVIMALLITVFTISFQQRLGEERIKRATLQQLEKNARYSSLPPEQQERQLNLSFTIQKYITYISPVFIFLLFLIGGLLYWLGIKAMDGEATFLQSLSVWIYSSFPPTIVSFLANFLILFLKSPDDIDILASRRGLINANPTMFFDGKEIPVLATLISTLDVFIIWGVVLAVIGLKKIGKLSTGSAFAIVFIITLIGITLRVIGAYLNGVPS
jgi:hypothetical protein